MLNCRFLTSCNIPESHTCPIGKKLYGFWACKSQENIMKPDKTVKTKPQETEGYGNYNSLNKITRNCRGRLEECEQNSTKLKDNSQNNIKKSPRNQA